MENWAGVVRLQYCRSLRGVRDCPARCCVWSFGGVSRVRVGLWGGWWGGVRWGACLSGVARSLVACSVSFGDVAGSVCCCDRSVAATMLYRGYVVCLKRVVRSWSFAAQVA
jgi:hypothetical protein